MVNTNIPVILLIGDERYLKEKAINELRSSLLDNSSGELDYKVLHGSDTSAEEILASASTIPFFSSKRLVVVKDFEKLPKEGISRIAAYIKNPNQYTCLVIDAKDGDIFKDFPLPAKYVKTLRFSGPVEEELSSWIEKFVSGKGKIIEEEAIEMLKELQGNDLLNLSQELEKLVTYAGGQKKITVADIENLVGKSVIASAFNIAHAVAETDTSRAVKIAYDIIASGRRPHELIGLLAWHFKTLANIKTLFSAGGTEYSITRELRLSRRNSREFFTQAALYSLEKIRSKLEILLEADLSIKRARYSPSLILEFTILKLCLG